MSTNVEQPAAPRIGVVIPYFQREAGLLHRALSSVAAQEYRPVQVVVVDDGSPHAAAREITPRLRNALQGLTVIRQANQGVAAARNAALDALGTDVSAVALLDSDDYWSAAHLRTAAAALSRRADFFFSNCRIEEEETDLFHEPGRSRLLGNFQPVEGAPGVVRWCDDLYALMGAACPFHTSTVVFRRAIMPHVRFPGGFRRAGEDQAAFWDLFRLSSVVMYSVEPTVTIGSGGLGTWRNAEFGSVSHLVRLADEIRLRRHLIRTHAVSAGDRRLMRRAIAVRRSGALHSALHLIRRRRDNVFSEILYLLRSDPGCAASWCRDLPTLVYRWIRGIPDTLR